MYVHYILLILLYICVYIYIFIISIYICILNHYVYIYIYIYCIYIIIYIHISTLYIYIYMHLCFFMFSLGLKRILQDTFHLQWENHGKCPCVSADFPEISWNNPKKLLLKNRTSGIYVCVLHMIYNYTFIYFKPYMYIYIYIIMYCRPTVKLELLAPSYLTNWSNMAVPRRHVLRHPRWLPSGQRRPAVRGAVRGPSSAITAIRCINMYMYTCMWITVYTIYTFMHIYIYIYIFLYTYI